MQEDPITNSFIDNVNRTLIERNVLLSKIALILSILFSLIVLRDWYNLFKDLKVSPKGISMIYAYRVLPAIHMILLAINMYGYILSVKGYRSINTSLEKSDPALLSLGFKYFYKSNILLVISFGISIIMNLLKRV